MTHSSLGRNALERFMSILFLLCGIVAVAFVLFISIYLLISGGPAQATTHLPILIYQRGMGQFKFGSAAAIAIMSGMIFIVLAIAYLKIQDKEDM